MVFSDFGGAYYILQITLEMVATRSSKMLMPIYQTTLWNTPIPLTAVRIFISLSKHTKMFQIIVKDINEIYILYYMNIIFTVDQWRGNWLYAKLRASSCDHSIKSSGSRKGVAFLAWITISFSKTFWRIFMYSVTCKWKSCPCA